MHIVVISGRSGSGKTIALHALEDLGFYCIDNLPISLFPHLYQELSSAYPKIAVSLDSRNLPKDLFNFKTILADYKKSGSSINIVYLDADEKVLMKRYSETRRKHPLTDSNTSLIEAIRKEQQLLSTIADLSTLTLDTSNLSQHQLHQMVRDKISVQKGSKMQLLLQSFGFKHGLPPDSDYIFDVRCLNNPYWQTGLRSLTGKDPAVQEFLVNNSEASQMCHDIAGFINKWLPKFEQDHRSYMCISIGCTGGNHRSVYIVEALSKMLSSNIADIQVRHRELGN
jgi:RNase adapter protein RapZ